MPRNDLVKHALQPKPRQVEWAVDQAITGNLNKLVSRPANWKNLGMPAYQPQSLFPLHALDGGGRIPAQVMLGITAQESNMWQASRVVVPGVTGNPLIGNYYGITYAADGEQGDPWGIHWADADCGYGITQVTDGMRMHGKEKPGETPLNTTQQEAVALDYTANIAAGVNILADKWNQMRRDGMTINNGDPRYMENWFFALWAYNSGYYPKANAAENGGLWGVGFTNNPANPLWKANRLPFLENASGGDDYPDAAHPQDWPYQEKVLGWGARPISALESPGTMVAGYRASWWNNNALRTAVKPAESLFCTAANQCDPSKIGPGDSNDPGMGACTRNDLKCWWNQPATWKNCGNAECGNEILRFNDTYPEQDDGTAYPPNCSTNGLPANALIVDDVPPGTPVHRPGCTAPTTSGSFSLEFGSDSARIDFQQLGAGFGSHFWFAHTRQSNAEGRRLEVVGTWSLGRTISEGQAKVFVHIPDHGAQTLFADYQVITSGGIRSKTVSQWEGTGNRWVELGVYRFKDTIPKVKLSSIAVDGTGDDDIAYDAVAFVPGDYSRTPNITFPYPDDEAPMPSWEGEPIVAHRTGVFAANTGDGTASMRCSHPDAKGGKVCLKIGEPQIEPTKPDGPGGGKASTRTIDSIVPWCTNHSAGKDYFTRTDACLKAKSPLLVIWIVNDDVVGTASFAMQQEIKLYNNLPEFDQQLTLVPTSIDASLGVISLQWIAGDECDDCAQSPKTWHGDMTWFGPTDYHTASGTFQTQWNGTGEETIRLGWELTGGISSAPGEVGAVGGADLGTTEGDLDVRCDDTTKGATNAGCVFPEYIPTYTVNTDRYPAAGAYYWVMKEKNSNHLGSKTHNKPLRYLANGQTDNREVVCPDAWDGRSETPTASCDEYAFATTYQSGGMPESGVTSGDQCAQFYTTPINSTTWTLLEDDRSGEVVNWSERCGRASIPLAQNTGALAPFGRTGGFVWYNRMQDNEPFWLATPGFDHCTESDTLCAFRRTND